ncbi:hypothetical protein JKP88DRAFT_241905 [Tribonema minus]|uniref:Uncharacterized protein n=1 Tax=Tribonema minus TaxID=303371 RepID=A0A835YPA1_9STRA|nr:hypothetical protein JKP88DRAFT_241905 [Tribonema minus]
MSVASSGVHAMLAFRASCALTLYHCSRSVVAAHSPHAPPEEALPATPQRPQPPELWPQTAVRRLLAATLRIHLLLHQKAHNICLPDGAQRELSFRHRRQQLRLLLHLFYRLVIAQALPQTLSACLKPAIII